MEIFTLGRQKGNFPRALKSVCSSSLLEKYSPIQFLSLENMFFSKIPTTRFLCVFFTFSLFLFLFSAFSLFLSLLFFSNEVEIHHSLSSLKHRFTVTHHNSFSESHPYKFRHVSSSLNHLQPSDSILLPDWEVLLLLFISPENPVPSDSGTDSFYCHFQKNTSSPAKFTGVLPFSNYATYKCALPNSIRRLRPFLRPILTESPVNLSENDSDSPNLFRWEFLAYESLSTETDVILFVKGVNNRQGVNRSPAELTCLFTNSGNNSVKTCVTSSSQEVFRCLHPNETSLRRLFLNGETKLKVSLQVTAAEEKKWAVPSVAYYTPPRRNVSLKVEKSLICACTMVYNVAKFLKEWIFYHSRIGVEKFILYDNGSGDDLKHVLKDLLEENFDIEVFLWPWPKTQEAGFSHCALQAKDSCTWMMFIDVDEFIFSPSWMNSSYPSHQTLRSLLPTISSSLLSSSLFSEKYGSLTNPIGQVLIGCWDFGPSNKKTHPIEGVTQGYTCRKRVEERHKSIVLLDAIDESLSNVVHHFRLKEGYRVKKLDKEKGVVNHYKYQAWSEFKVKFRRRVSTYVVDWRRKVNPKSKDRTPGLGFEPVEPKGWTNQFCEVHDNRLKEVTQKWFGVSYSNIGNRKMAWQDDDD